MTNYFLCFRSSFGSSPITRLFSTVLFLYLFSPTTQADVFYKVPTPNGVTVGSIGLGQIFEYPLNSGDAVKLCKVVGSSYFDTASDITPITIPNETTPGVNVTCGFSWDPTVHSVIQRPLAARCPSHTGPYANYGWSNDGFLTNYAKWGWKDELGEDGYWCSARCAKEDTDILGQCKRSENLGSCPVATTEMPISIALGNKFLREVDYLGSGEFPLQFTRYYNSRATSLAYTASYTAPWRHEYERRVDVMRTQGGSSLITVDRPDGRTAAFNEMSGTFFPIHADRKDTLEKLTDTSGGLLGWRFKAALTDEIENYDSDGRLLTVTNRSGVTHTLAYSTGATPLSVAPFSGLLIGVSDSFGKSLQFTYDSQSRIATMTDPAGGIYTYGYANSGNARLITSVMKPDSTSKTYLYNEPSHISGDAFGLTGILDESGVRVATYKYDTQGRAYYEEAGGGIAGATTLGYGANSTTVTDSLNTQRTYSFQDVLGVARSSGVNQPGGSGCGASGQSMGYDINGNVSSRTDFDGNQTTYLYDLARNLETSRTEAAGTPRQRTITTAWHPTFRLPTLITEPGRTTSIGYDTYGNVQTRTITDTTLGTSRTWTYTYFNNGLLGQVQSIDGPRPNSDVADVTTFAWNNCTTGAGCGQIHSITDALGHSTTFNTYNANGQPLQITDDANNIVTDLAYDNRHRLTKRTVAGEQTQFDYWPTGLLKKVTLPDGSYLGYSYDDAHRLVGIADSIGNHIDYTLDAAGNRKIEQLSDASSPTSSHVRAFDALGRLYQELTAANTPAQTTTFGYDANGNATTVNAPLGRNSTSAYDELNRLKQVTDANATTTVYGYNALDQLVSVTDPKTLQTTYNYNALGDLIDQVSPDTGATHSIYDAGGNLKTSTDANNIMATYTYDALNRVKTVVYPDQTQTFMYDTATNGVGKIASVTDNSGSTAWTYNTKGRIESKTQVMGTVTKAVHYDYNAAGQLWHIYTPSGKTIEYAYTNNQVSAIYVNGIPVLNNVQYEPFGPTGGWTWGNNTLAIRTYDTDGKPFQFDSAGQTTYAYDDAFRVTGITDASNSANSSTYDYDLLDRLKTNTKTGLNETFTYDANGNRQSQGGTNSSTFTNASTSNKLSSVSGALTRTYSYDNVGNTTNDGSRAFTYNNAGRMLTATSAGVTTTYSVNALGQRVKKSNAGGTTYFVYDEAGHLQGEYDQAGTLIQEIVWLNDTPVATIRFGSCGIAIFYIHTDHLDTPRRITKRSDNQIVWRWDSDAFGNTPANENPSGLGTFSFNVRFPGQYADQETGLLYNWNRYYDPQTGRYVTSDPIGLHGGLNTYAYVRANPVMKFDPLGLSPADVQAIMEYSRGWVDYMTAERYRIDPGWRNDLCFWERRLGIKDSRCREDTDYSGCMEQATNLMKYLKAGVRNGKLRLDDEWNFERDSLLFFHFWVEAQSSNPGDPRLFLDPFNRDFHPIEPGIPMGYPE